MSIHSLLTCQQTDYSVISRVVSILYVWWLCLLSAWSSWNCVSWNSVPWIVWAGLAQEASAGDQGAVREQPFRQQVHSPLGPELPAHLLAEEGPSPRSSCEHSPDGKGNAFPAGPGDARLPRLLCCLLTCRDTTVFPS